MSTYETSITVSVYVDPDYHYEVSAGDMLEVIYVENNTNHKTAISFGSVDEMEEVAKAILKVVALSKEK